MMSRCRKCTGFARYGWMRRRQMGKIKYKCPYEILYRSDRYGEWVTVPKGYPSDGATGAMDIWSEGWWVHDRLCNTGVFDSGRRCTCKQASQILSDILKEEGRVFRSFYWKWATRWFGPKELGGTPVKGFDV